ncbi:MAG: ribosome small subunit-dependent GTPase A [Bacteroidales bacterium]|nr:ribosome small subunit-dependent GTPase A [Bacteroidales bacterium]
MDFEGRVVKSTGSWYIVRTPGGNVVDCRLKGKFRMHDLKNTNPVVVGDLVTVTAVSDTEWIISKIHPRNNYIIRKATKSSKTLHILASNVDQAVVVASICNPRTPPGFLDRFLVTAEAYNIPGIVIFNKTDLYTEEDYDNLEYFRLVYNQAGYKVLTASALEGKGMDEIAAILSGKITLMAGNSGVGKSALINRLEPGLNIKTQEISDYNSKGKHTTTFAQMHSLSFGGYIIDSPGIKEFGLIDFKKEEVGLYFPEMKKILEKCQFYNCTHSHEPGCAVKIAVENGLIAHTRYTSYLNIIDDKELETYN